MKKNTFTVLFSKFGVALFFLMFLLWNEGTAQSYVSPEIAKTRLTEQATAWHRQAKQNPNQAGVNQLIIKSSIYEKMVSLLDAGLSVDAAIQKGVSAYPAHVKAAEPSQTGVLALSAAFKTSTQTLLSN